MTRNERDSMIVYILTFGDDYEIDSCDLETLSDGELETMYEELLENEVE